MALISTISEFKNYIAIDGNAKWATIKPFVNEAEMLYIVPLLGKEFYDEFRAAYTASVAETPTPLSEENAVLLPYIQRPLAYYTMLQAIPHITVTFGELGIRQHRSDDSDAAPRWKQNELQFQALKMADIHADKLLEYLEETATDEIHGTWFNSTANVKTKGLIVYSTGILSNHISINNSRRVYLALRNTIRDVEARHISKLIGKAQYDEIVQQIVSSSLSIENEALVQKLEPIISKYSLYLRLQFMRVQIAGEGIVIYSGTDEIFKPNQMATDADIRILRQQLHDEPLGYISDEKELKQFYLDNIDDYPLIKASNLYTIRPDPGPEWTPTNSDNNKHFIV